MNPYFFTDHLQATEAQDDVHDAMMAVAHAGKDVYQTFKTQKAVYGQKMNASGDIQLSHDVLADEIFAEALRKSNAVSCYVSEEKSSQMCFLEHTKHSLLVAYDPIDGSSIVKGGFTVGASFGFYRGVPELLNATGRHMVGALYLLFGPQILLAYSVGNGVHTFSLNEATGKYELEQEHLSLAGNVKVVGYGGMQHSCSIGGFPDLIRHWEKEQYSLRYSGSMAADVNGVLSRGGGLFLYPAEKLRMLYECNPFAYLVEQAGGKATNLRGEPILDQTITDINQTSPIILGSTAQVDEALSFFTNLAKQKGCVL